MRPHLIDSIQFRFDTHVGEDAVFGVEQFAKSFEEQHVWGQFAFIFMFDAEEHVVVGFVVAVLIYFGLGFVEVNPGVSEIILLHPNWVEDGFVQPWVYVPLAEELCLMECLIDKFDFDVLFGA